jgi:hypothetical protein
VASQSLSVRAQVKDKDKARAASALPIKVGKDKALPAVVLRSVPDLPAHAVVRIPPDAPAWAVRVQDSAVVPVLPACCRLRLRALRPAQRVVPPVAIAAPDSAMNRAV